MLVDCQTCPVRDVHCADCMVTALTAIPVLMADGSRARAPGAAGEADPGALLHPGPTTVPLDRAERRAISVLIAAGLVTPATANAAGACLDPVVPVTARRTRPAV